MFHEVDAPGSSALPPPIPTRVWMPHDPHTLVPFQYVLQHQSHSGASSSLAHHSNASYMHDYPPIVLDDFLVGASGDLPLYLQGNYDTSEQMSSYAPGSGDVQGGHGDETTVQAGGDGEGGDVSEDRDVQESQPSEDVQGKTPKPSRPSGVIIQMINDNLGVRLSVSRSGDAHHGISMSVVFTASDSACLLTEVRAPCYLLGLPVVSYEIWPIVRNLWRISYIQHFVIIGQRSGTITLSNYRMRLDIMTAAEFRCTPYKGIPHAPVISLVEHCRPASTKSYVVRHTFTREFWYDILSHCVNADHMRHIAIPTHDCHPSYMP
ncbi:hypothetical protein M9H77_03850 [Catharanthus roseus]|uniref:Uncharacterized protein n=1 Tax=Catharanthus roseus TaxID=4058 RepID=A0ACC0CCN2_CATRO|nr:hypothetical protein M9H77_03850 [Catharanthus roseus]